MGLFDSIAGQVASAISQNTGGQQPGILEAAIGLLNNPATGGIQGLINTFQEKGLGNLISSWVGTGENLPISNEQLTAVLGNAQVQALAQKLGISTEAISSQLSALLPQLVDKVTPSGTVPEDSSLENALGSLGGLFK